jgi:hypothetical protein
MREPEGWKRCQHDSSERGDKCNSGKGFSRWQPFDLSYDEIQIAFDPGNIAANQIGFV